MLFAELAATSDAVAATPKRSVKTAEIARLLREAAPEEVAPLVGFLTGRLRQGRVGVGWATLRPVWDVPPATSPSLTVGDVDALCAALAATTGPSSQERRRALLATAFAAATEPEARLLASLLGGELRQGALDGVVAEAVAAASGVPIALVRRAAMLSGDLGAASAAALGPEGADAVAAIGLSVGVFVQPMLASPAVDLDEALASAARVSIEWKLDGARVEVHRLTDGTVRVFTRNGNEIADRLPAVVEVVRTFPGAPFVLDGEAIGLDDDGVPRRFQDTMSRFGADRPAEPAPDGADAPLQAYFFDVLHAEGVDLIDRPLEVRQATLDVIATRWVVPRTTDRATAAGFAADALARRHEGVMVKDLDSRYEAGRRGAAWRKVKPVITLDLVVLAAEWGHGRRTGWLSNLHLGALDDTPPAPDAPAPNPSDPRPPGPGASGSGPSGPGASGSGPSRPDSSGPSPRDASPSGPGSPHPSPSPVDPSGPGSPHPSPSRPDSSGPRPPGPSGEAGGGRDSHADGLPRFVMVGKTFKGLTDELLAWQTERLRELAVRESRGTVWVRPELVVEVALDGVQRSTRYPGGVALRFARVRAYRPDKSPSDADTITTVRALLS